MEPLIVQINWIWALGIIGTLLILAWRASARFTRIETDVKWLVTAVRELQIRLERKK